MNSLRHLPGLYAAFATVLVGGIVVALVIRPGHGYFELLMAAVYTLAGLIIALLFVDWLVIRRRIARGTCPRCGSDLATPGLCLACGAPRSGERM